ncbi:MAG TPA: glycosyltransferase [Candidatus Bathyarchaeia archaeon]|nr:glycosyltransferase [Candidatus Bathyarchaeia archaeon]
MTVLRTISFTTIFFSFFVSTAWGNDPQVQNILFVMGFFPVITETFILNQITGLIDRGYTVNIHAFKKRSPDIMHADVKTYKLLDCTTYGNRVPDLKKYDVIYCQFGFHGERLVKVVKKKKKKFAVLAPIITCFRGSDMSAYVQKKPAVYKELFKQGELFFPVCSYFANILVRLGCKPEKIMVHHSGIDTDRFVYVERPRAEHRRLTIATVGRLIEKKGIEDAIRAVAPLIPMYNISYIIVGDGPERKYLEKLVKELRIENSVHFYGWVTQQEVIELLAHADLFILPSVTGSDNNQEGIPNALKEAMASGLPVISTYHAGIPELVDDMINGLLVPPHDIHALSRALIYLITHPDQATMMGKKGREKVEQEFDRDRLLDRLEDIFYECIRKRSARNA